MKLPLILFQTLTYSVTGNDWACCARESKYKYSFARQIEPTGNKKLKLGIYIYLDELYTYENKYI